MNRGYRTKNPHSVDALRTMEAKEQCNSCSDLVEVEDGWWCSKFSCMVGRIINCMRWTGAIY